MKFFLITKDHKIRLCFLLGFLFRLLNHNECKRKKKISIKLKKIGIVLLILFAIILPASASTTGLISNPIKHKPIPIPTLTSDTGISSKSSANQVIIGDFQNFLVEWNEKMGWGISTQQIEKYNHSLTNNILKKYQTTPGYPILDIPDIKLFCLEVGNAIGLTKNQSEEFAAAADDNLRKDKIEFDKPLLVLGLDTQGYNTIQQSSQQGNTLSGADTESAPYAYGKVDYEYIFVDFTSPSPVPSGKSYAWTSEDIDKALNDAYYGTYAISNQAPSQATMTNVGYYWPTITISGSNPGRVAASTNPDGWMENAIRQLGYTDTNGDGRVSDEFARDNKASEGADAIVIIYCTHDARGAYAAGTFWGYADKAVISFWGLNGNNFFNSAPGSYEHETVHLFGALDEWVGASDCGEQSIFAVSPMREMYTNTNHQNCVGHLDGSVMNDPYSYSFISGSSRNFIGWGDFDGDNILDPLDSDPYNPPTLPIAGFAADTVRPRVNQRVTFVDQSYNTTSWAWDFENDGIVDSTAQNPVHTYAAGGTYTVKLTASNAYGSDDEIKAGYIVVNGLAVRPLPGYANPPTDPDSDGLYEDLNGNNRKDMGDVVLFMDNLIWIKNNEPLAAFDFNHNGRIDVGDVTALLDEMGQ
jgi:PKD repeat protein